MSFFKFMNPAYDDSHIHEPRIRPVPTVFLRLDHLFQGYSDQKPFHCPVFEFREGFWTEPKHHAPDESWQQSAMMLYVPEGPYYASLRNYSGKSKRFTTAELLIQTIIEEERVDFMQYTFRNAHVIGVSLNHEKQFIELLLGCDKITLEIRNIDPETKNVMGKSVSEIDMVTHKVC